MVPQSLRFWFVIHFVFDFIFAIPLLIAPVWLLTLLANKMRSVLTMLGIIIGVASVIALLGIGGESLLGWNGPIEAFRAMLNLKIIWSLAAIFGIILTLIFNDGPLMAYVVLLLFAVFSGLWMYYRFLLR